MFQIAHSWWNMKQRKLSRRYVTTIWRMIAKYILAKGFSRVVYNFSRNALEIYLGFHFYFLEVRYFIFLFFIPSFRGNNQVLLFRCSSIYRSSGASSFKFTILNSCLTKRKVPQFTCGNIHQNRSSFYSLFTFLFFQSRLWEMHGVCFMTLASNCLTYQI